MCLMSLFSLLADSGTKALYNGIDPYASRSAHSGEGGTMMNITPLIPDGYIGPIKRLNCRVCGHTFYITQADYDAMQEVLYCHECSMILASEVGKAQATKAPAHKGFYPKPRVALGKSPQPLRCNPIVIEQIGPQRDDGGAIGPSPTHASLFHAAVDHQGHRSLDHAAAHRIAKLAPVLIGPNPRTLVLQIRDRLRDGLKWLGWQSCSQGAQSLHRLIDAAMPEPRPVQEQLVVSFSLREGLGSCRHSDGVTDLAPQMRPV